jgi:Na+-transporting NADH:ubiquinone oxidoreductase subunit NqrC
MKSIKPIYITDVYVVEKDKQNQKVKLDKKYDLINASHQLTPRIETITIDNSGRKTIITLCSSVLGYIKIECSYRGGNK